MRFGKGQGAKFTTLPSPSSCSERVLLSGAGGFPLIAPGPLTKGKNPGASRDRTGTVTDHIPVAR